MAIMRRGYVSKEQATKHRLHQAACVLKAGYSPALVGGSPLLNERDAAHAQIVADGMAANWAWFEHPEGMRVWLVDDEHGKGLYAEWRQ